MALNPRLDDETAMSRHHRPSHLVGALYLLSATLGVLLFYPFLCATLYVVDIVYYGYAAAKWQWVASNLFVAIALAGSLWLVMLSYAHHVSRRERRAAARREGLTNVVAAR